MGIAVSLICCFAWQGNACVAAELETAAPPLRTPGGAELQGEIHSQLTTLMKERRQFEREQRQAEDRLRQMRADAEWLRLLVALGALGTAVLLGTSIFYFRRQFAALARARAPVPWLGQRSAQSDLPSADDAPNIESIRTALAANAPLDIDLSVLLPLDRAGHTASVAGSANGAANWLVQMNGSAGWGPDAEFPSAAARVEASTTSVNPLFASLTVDHRPTSMRTFGLDNAAMPSWDDTSNGVTGAAPASNRLPLKKMPLEKMPIEVTPIEVTPIKAKPAVPSLDALTQALPSGLEQRLAILAPSEELRAQIATDPGLLRALVQGSLEVLLRAPNTRSATDWRLLVIDAWRRGNFDEASERTTAMLQAACTELERNDAHALRGAVSAARGRDASTATVVAATGSTRWGADETDSRVTLRAARQLLQSGVGQRGEQEHSVAARASFEQLLSLIGGRRDGEFSALVARARINLALVESGPGGDPGRAVQLYDSVQREFGHAEDAILATSVAQARFNRAALALDRYGDVAAAVTAYTQLVESCAVRTEPAFELLLAQALSDLAWLQARELGDVRVALDSYGDLEAHFADHPDKDIALLAARGLFASASLWAVNVGATARAMLMYEAVIRRYALRDDSEFRRLVARARINIAVIRTWSGVDHVGAMQAYEDAIDNLTANPDPSVDDLLASALVNQASLCARTHGDYVAALALYERVVREFGDRSQLAIDEQVAKALLNMGVVHAWREDVDAAAAAFEDLERRYADHADARVACVVARGMIQHAVLCATRRHETERAYQRLDQVLRRYGERSETVLIEAVARAMMVHAELLVAYADIDDAIAAYKKVWERFGAATESSIVLVVAKSLVKWASLQLELGLDPAATERALATFIDRFGTRNEIQLQAVIASALLLQARTLSALGEHERTRMSYQRLIDVFSTSAQPEVRDYVARANVSLTEMQRAS